MVFNFISSLTITELMLFIPVLVTLNVAFLGLYHLTVLDRRIKKVNNTLLIQARNAMLLSLLVTTTIALSGITTGTSALVFSIISNALTTCFIYQIYESNFSDNKSAIRLNRNIFITLILIIALTSLLIFNEPETKWLRGRSSQILLMYFSLASIFVGIRNWQENNSAQRSLTVIWVITVLLFIVYVVMYTPEIPAAFVALSFLVLTTTLLLGFLLASVSSLNLQLIQSISDLSEIDWLTGLKNRRFFFKHVHSLISLANRQNLPCTVAIFDLDDFKIVNDTYGHDAGDNVLKAFALSMKETFRNHTLLARWGGEEFLAFFPMTSVADAEEAIARFQAMGQDPQIEYEGSPVPISFSVGVADCSSRESLEDSIKEADRALYQAKSNGKNQIKLSPDQHERL
ncbi:GGDEF domain-containing protein [Reinekea sp.]|jgi:diguanylate cyclase (GGDEF)-like protein|uniref:GGDEF domain-containing protein n=1 Tax=Reinekea sp. TaxID=1970455 RepID=UPI003989419F